MVWIAAAFPTSFGRIIMAKITIMIITTAMTMLTITAIIITVTTRAMTMGTPITAWRKPAAGRNTKQRDG